MTETLLDRIRGCLDAAMGYNENDGEKPVALLWPDKQQQWGGVLEPLRETHRIVSFGDYDESAFIGPAYWLRCVVSGALDLVGLVAGMPILYLPGVDRDDLRNPQSAPEELKPLGGLQHRSLWFTHPGGRDWTVRSLLQNKVERLGLSVARDDATAEALVAALPLLSGMPFESLSGRHISAGFLQQLLSPDAVGSLLRWIDNPQEHRDTMGQAQWNAFTALCKSDFGFDPESDGEITAAQQLGLATGAWETVWKRFEDNPRSYPGVRKRLKQAQPGELLPEHRHAWPGINESDESQLRNALQECADLSPTSAAVKLATLEAEHAARRGTVWAELGEAPLATALEHLHALAKHTAAPLEGATVDELLAGYTQHGWCADLALIRALSAVEHQDDTQAVIAAAQVLYTAWAHQSSLNLQAAVGPMVNAGTYEADDAVAAAPGVVTVFVDGLRLDLAHLLQEQLVAHHFNADLQVALAALPTVTETAKPALIPAGRSELVAGEQLNAARADSGAKASIAVLRLVMEAGGVQILEDGDMGDVSGSAWTEAGAIDHLGHERGLRFVHEVDKEIAQIAARVRSLLDAGWETVQVVTDHGWLLVPGGLEKIELAASVYEPGGRKGRCARLKPDAEVPVDTVPWYWDPTVKIAIAPGIGCFTANQVYEHGGVSPQECFVPRMTVTSGARIGSQPTISIGAVTWAGLRCKVELLNAPAGTGVDIRQAAGDAGSSVAVAAKQTGGEATVTLLVPDEELEGTEATLVVFESSGDLLGQKKVTIGQNS